MGYGTACQGAMRPPTQPPRPPRPHHDLQYSVNNSVNVGPSLPPASYKAAPDGCRTGRLTLARRSLRVERGAAHRAVRVPVLSAPGLATAALLLMYLK